MCFEYSGYICCTSQKHRRTPHKELCGNSEQSIAWKGLCSITQKYFQLPKIGQVWSSQQHTQTGNPDPSAWQIALIMVLPWHVSAASSSGVTFLSATLRGFISFCKGKTLHVTWTEVSRSKIVIPEKNNLF